MSVNIVISLLWQDSSSSHYLLTSANLNVIYVLRRWDDSMCVVHCILNFASCFAQTLQELGLVNVYVHGVLNIKI
jgi:hypothetical protein